MSVNVRFGVTRLHGPSTDPFSSVAVYDATDYFMGPQKDPSEFHLGRFEELKPWPMTEIPKGSFCAVIHSVTRYRKADAWVVSWNYYAVIVLGDMEP